jgi:hypothetical protein
VRFFRPIACAALVSSASACTILYAFGNFYPDADAAAAADAGEGGADVVAPQLVRMTLGVGSVVAYGDTLYANVGGALEACDDDGGCAALSPLVPAEAGVTDPPGIAANDGGVYWVQGNGVWAALLDGTSAAHVITDPNNAQVLALDGERVSWTTQNLSGNVVIHSCMHPRSFCGFPLGGPKDGGPLLDSGGFTGGGSPAQIVGPDAGVDNQYLAAGSGYVAWVNVSTTHLELTTISGSTTDIDPKSTAIANASDITMVTSEGPAVFVSFHDDVHGTWAVFAVASPTALGSSPTGVIGNSNQSFCLTASNGLIGYSTSKNTLDVIAPDGGSAGSIPLGDAAAAQTFAATTHYFFVLDKTHALYRYPRF